MKIFVLIVAIISVVSVEEELEYSQFKWTGNIKTLYDTANYTRFDIPEIINNIFRDIKMNCKGNIGMPNISYIPSPTEDCDLRQSDELTKRLFKGYSEDYEIFLYDFWASDVGINFLIEMSRRGVDRNVVKEALKETWFTQSDDADYPFNRIFLEADRVGSVRHSRLNTWYTFEKDYKNRTNCGITIYGKDLPVLVEGSCEVPSYRSTSHFMIPNHPFVDLVLYSICVWSIPDYSYLSRICAIPTPWSDTIFYIAANTYMDSDNKGYLNTVHYS